MPGVVQRAGCPVGDKGIRHGDGQDMADLGEGRGRRLMDAFVILLRGVSAVPVRLDGSRFVSPRLRRRHLGLGMGSADGGLTSSSSFCG